MLADQLFHVIHFDKPDAAEAFVRALQRFLDGPRGAAWSTKFNVTEVWAPKALSQSPAEVYLTDSALMPAEAAFTDVPVAAALRGRELPPESQLLLKGATLQ